MILVHIFFFTETRVPVMAMRVFLFYLFFIVTGLTEILETKIFTCSFQCPYIKLHFGINESLMTL